jgi:hypothetical protein
MIALLVALAATDALVSWSREIAPILAFHCNRCHEGPGLDTRSYGGLLRGGALGPAIIPGDPERSPLVQFVEGRRGEARRMPLGEPPLGAGEVARIQRWVAEGAREDQDATAQYVITAGGLKRGPLEVRVWSPERAYLVMSVRDGKQRVLLERAAAGTEAAWRLEPERGWPRRVEVRLVIKYAAREPAGARLEVNGRVASL